MAGRNCSQPLPRLRQEELCYKGLLGRGQDRQQMGRCGQIYKQEQQQEQSPLQTSGTERTLLLRPRTLKKGSLKRVENNFGIIPTSYWEIKLSVFGGILL